MNSNLSTHAFLQFTYDDWEPISSPWEVLSFQTGCMCQHLFIYLEFRIFFWLGFSQDVWVETILMRLMTTMVDDPCMTIFFNRRWCLEKISNKRRQTRIIYSIIRKESIWIVHGKWRRWRRNRVGWSEVETSFVTVKSKKPKAIFTWRLSSPQSSSDLTDANVCSLLTLCHSLNWGASQSQDRK